MKVIFLDIDGVLNHEEHFRWLHESGEATPLQSQYPWSEFSPVSCKLLKEVIDETDAQIVVSSSWRLDGLAKINKLFRFFGLPNAIDVTPCLNTARGIEIDKWLSEHPEVDKYVILDDDTDMLPKQMSFFVKTNPDEDGLNVECKYKVIEILNNR